MALAAVAVPMVRMRIAGTRHAIKDPNRANWMITGAFLGVVLAAATIWAGVRDPDAVAVALAVWMLGWVAGPLFAGGGDETLRPEYFTVLPLRPRQLAGGLLAAAFAGIAPAISLLALLALLVVGVRLTVAAAVVAVPVMLLQLACFVLASRLAVAAYGVLLRFRTGAVLAGLVNAFALAFTAQGWALIAAYVSSDVQGVMARAARFSPSGWGLDAVEAAGTGEWWRAALAVGGLALLCWAMYAGWAALLVRRTTASRAGVRPRRPLDAHDARTAATGKEVRTWSRDLLAGYRLAFAFGYGLIFCLLPLAVGWTGMVPWAGPVVVLMAGAGAANLYGADGTALWLVLTTPGAVCPDVRAKQRAFLLVLTPPVTALTAVLTWWSGQTSAWPLVTAVLPALLGGAAGLTVLMSVLAAVPGLDPQQRSGNPLSTGGDDGQAIGSQYAMLAATAAVAGPALLVALFWSWWGVPAGVATGLLAWWGFGRIAVWRLERRGPELLSLLRYGRSPSTVKRAKLELPRGKRQLVGFCLGFGAIPLVPQGIVPVVFKLTGTEVRSWFLAMYVADPWSWLVAAGMILLGLAMYGYGLLVMVQARRP